MKKTVLFLCTGNSARSQMAEGLLRHGGGDAFEVFSAGTKPTSVNPYAVKVMKEIGIDISSQSSKSLEIFLGREFDYIVTLCGSAQQTCPAFPGKAVRMHWDLEDPAAATGSDEEIAGTFRKTRDIIRKKIAETFSVR